MNLIHAPSTEKKSQLERLLQFGKVMIFLDSRKTEVRVPPNHKGNLQLALNLSYSFQIPDFKVFEDHVEVTLSFPEGKFFCHLPFSAIYGMTSQPCSQTVMFPTEVPPELLKGANLKAMPPPTITPDPKSKTKKHVLSRVEGKKRGHLKLVK